MRDVTLASCLSLKLSEWVAFPVGLYSGKDVTTVLVVVKTATVRGLVVTDDDRLFITSLVCIAEKDVVRFGENEYSSIKYFERSLLVVNGALLRGLVAVRTGGTVVVCLTTTLNR